LSQALSKYLLEEGVKAAKIENFADIPGKGISGWYDQQQYFAGSLSLLESQGVIINNADSQLIKEMEEGAYSLILLATPDKLLAAAAISDRVRESAASAVAALKSMKIEVIMLTGDHGASAKQIAAQAGIEVFESGLSPEDKAAGIRRLQADGHHVAMAGDGINDTIALAAADTGIAMGSGSDASIETAAITITGSSLHQIVEAIRLSRKTNRIIRQNLFWAFFYNVLMLPLAAGLFFSFTHQLLNPMIASAAMALSSVSVVTNSLRIRNS
jgi:Cu2+-exporting ATPase